MFATHCYSALFNLFNKIHWNEENEVKLLINLFLPTTIILHLRYWRKWTGMKKMKKIIEELLFVNQCYSPLNLFMKWTGVKKMDWNYWTTYTQNLDQQLRKDHFHKVNECRVIHVFFRFIVSCQQANIISVTLFIPPTVCALKYPLLKWSQLANVKRDMNSGCSMYKCQKYNT